MGCRHSNFLDGKCLLWEKASPLNPEGVDEDGFCIAEEDPDPSWCQSYEGDGWEEDFCDECGMWLDECTCED